MGLGWGQINLKSDYVIYRRHRTIEYLMTSFVSNDVETSVVVTFLSKISFTRKTRLYHRKKQTIVGVYEVDLLTLTEDTAGCQICREALKAPKSTVIDIQTLCECQSTH